VIHPRARLDSTGGPVNIGRRCIVHERTHVGAGADPDAADPAEGSVTLGDCVTVEVGAVVETGGTAVGEGTIVGVACRVGRGASIGKVCASRRGERRPGWVADGAAALHAIAAYRRRSGRKDPRLHGAVLER